MIKYLISYLALFFAMASKAFAAESGAGLKFGVDTKKVDSKLVGSEQTLDVAAQTLIANFTAFLYIIAVVYALWGGFQILTAGGEEDKVNKGKDIIIQALIGLVVIFLANSIVVFLINSILGVSGGSGS